MTESEIAQFQQLSTQVGLNPLLTQGSTGNTSIKTLDSLWIKASGKWLADALRREIFIPIDLEEGRGCMRRGIDPAEIFTGPPGSEAKASVETAMHLTIPHRVVVHVHSINTLAWAVRQDAETRLTSRLDGLNWAWIPYVASGLALARELEKALSRSSGTNVFVLGNHGLVIAAEDCKGARALLDDVERRVRIPPRPVPEPDTPASVPAALSDSGWKFPDHAGIHALGTDSAARAILSGGLLYPCQAIFSNSRSAEVFRSVSPAAPDLGRAQRSFLIVDGCGVLVRDGIGQSEYAMLEGLAQVVQRIESPAPIRYLTSAEIAASLAAAADRYR